MFEIKIQNNTSEKNAMNKNILDILTLSGTLKQSTSIVDPVIRIETDNAAVFKCNYLTIDSFGRSYFVNDITSINNNLIELKCHVDVLQSYKSEILANEAIVKKQENKWNLYLNDGSLKVYQNPMVLTKNFPGGFDTLQFILSVAG